MTSDNKSVLAFNLSFMFPQKELLSTFVKQMIAWIDEGRLQPPTVTCYPVEKVAEAHKAIESGTTVGKLVLTFNTMHERSEEKVHTGRDKAD